MPFQIPSLITAKLKSLIKFEEFIYLFLVIAAGLALLGPYHNFQLHLAQGDHGNNLYCFKKTLDGAMPYRDYWWVYGPLMPYYYSLFFRLFGVSIHSVVIGYTFLNLLCGIFFYKILRLFFASYLAFAATIWFWVFNHPFEHTYNHIGGVLAIIVSVYYLFCYIKTAQIRHIIFGLISIFILSLIKLNFGLATLLAFILCLGVIDWAYKRPMTLEKRKTYLLAALGLPVLIFGAYWIFIQGLPFYAIRQCLTYFDPDPNHSTFFNSLRIFFQHEFTQLTGGQYLGFWAVLAGATGYLFYLIFRKRLDKTQKTLLLVMLFSLFIMTAFNLHEFILSGVTYRTYWIEPLGILAIFIIIFTAFASLAKIARFLLFCFILAVPLCNHLARYQFIEVVKYYLPHERAGVYITNQPAWSLTVMKVTNYLKRNLKADETFFAVPSDQLYYFLTGKDCPNRQSEFGIKINPKQEIDVITSLEKKKVNYILLSNRCRMPEAGFGPFGEAYCRILGGYIRSNFHPAALIGDWKKNPTWFADHGVLILRRNNP